MSVALDSWAVIEWLRGREPATTAINDLFDASEAPVISWINLAEVHYRWIRDHGHARATATTTALEESLRTNLPTRETVFVAAELKAEHPMALGDCFAVATAAKFGLELWTGDPEIVERRSVLPCAVRDLR